MSKITRYNLDSYEGELYVDDEGDYVKYEDIEPIIKKTINYLEEHNWTKAAKWLKEIINEIKT